MPNILKTIFTNLKPYTLAVKDVYKTYAHIPNRRAAREYLFDAMSHPNELLKYSRHNWLDVKPSWNSKLRINLDSVIDLDTKYRWLADDAISQTWQDYNYLYDFAKTNPILQNIANESPQYLPEIARFVQSGSDDIESFVKNLVTRANTFRRTMSPSLRYKTLQADDFLTLRGMSNRTPGMGTIDVEGVSPSNWGRDYGSVAGYYEMDVPLTGNVDTWWSQRTLGNNVSQGMHSLEGIYDKELKKLISSSNNTFAGHVLGFTGLRHYNKGIKPIRKFVNYPVHQVFVGPFDSKINGFKVTVGTPPQHLMLNGKLDIGKFSKGYKTGGKLKWLK